MEEQIVLIPLQISVFETICVSEWLIVGVIVERITLSEAMPKNGTTLVSIGEYRQLLGDNTSADKQIVKRLQYLEAFCRSIIKPALQKYEQ